MSKEQFRFLCKYINKFYIIEWIDIPKYLFKNKNSHNVVRTSSFFIYHKHGAYDGLNIEHNNIAVYARSFKSLYRRYIYIPYVVAKNL